MQNSQNKKLLQIGLLVLIAVVTLGIGYASITAINLLINGNATVSVNQENFNVHFVSADNITGTTGVSGTATYDGVNAEFDVTGLTKVGDYAIAKYTVRNDSVAIGTEITLDLSITNTEYFKVTETIDDNKLQAGEETTATVKAEMIKTPINDEVTTSVIAKLIANPIENVSATGGAIKEKMRPLPYTYTLYTLESNSYINLGSELSSHARSYSSFTAAKNSFRHPVVTAHAIEDGKTVEAYVVFEKNNNVYYLRGGAGIEPIDGAMPIYNKNVQTIKEAYGSEWANYCSETIQQYDSSDYYIFNCNGDNWNIMANTYGHVRAVNNGSGDCHVFWFGGARCFSNGSFSQQP